MAFYYAQDVLPTKQEPCDSDHVMAVVNDFSGGFALPNLQMGGAGNQPVAPTGGTASWEECEKMFDATNLEDATTAHYYSHDASNGNATSAERSPGSDSSATLKSEGDAGLHNGGYQMQLGNTATPAGAKQLLTGDENLTPEELETKRKAQNRAAQRAFRERKEQRVRELEAKLLVVTTEIDKLRADNERLTKENTILMTENQVLQSVSNRAAQEERQRAPVANEAQPQVTFPTHDLYKSLRGTPQEGEVARSYIVYENKERGDTMLGSGAVWQMLMEDPDLSGNDQAVNFVVDYIKDKSACDGYGPVFSLRCVHEGIRLAKEQKAR